MKANSKRNSDKAKSPSSNRSTTPNKGLNSSIYFCHFRNAMYMGGIKAFQKHGQGILLHDNGTCVLSSYYNDFMHGHNIFFMNRCLVSAQYIKNKISEVVYRTDGFLLSLLYNTQQQLEGRCLLLNYINKTLLYVIFKKGVLIEKKQEKDYTTLNRVFDIGSLDHLIGMKHFKVINYEIDKIFNVSVQKIGNKLVVGFSKNGLLNGLGFSLFIRGTHGGYNPDTHRTQDDFELKLVQRGYYVNSQLHGLGQKWFKNGNLYIGQFKNDTFSGSGILKNVLKKNWVSGYFEKGNLVDLVQYSNQGQDKKCQKLIQSLHERKTNWINNQIIIINCQNLDQQIQKIINLAPNIQIKTLQQRKQQVLKKIQDNFICDNQDLPSSISSRNMETFNQISKNNLLENHQKEEAKKFVKSFIPESSQGITETKKVNFLNQQFNKIGNSQVNQDSKMLSSSGRKASLRKSKIFEPQKNSKSADSLIKLYRVPNESQRAPSSKSKKYNIFNPLSSRSKQEDDLGAASNRLDLTGKVYKSRGPLDSKRIIGRSRIFKYLQNEPEEQPPKFNYNISEMAATDKKMSYGALSSSIKTK